MVATAQRSRAPIARLADQVASWFVPLVIAAALLAFAAWSIYGPEPRFTFGLVAAVSVLIIACPCALGLATPMSIMVGVGRGAQAGILVKNAEALERMEKVDTLIVDKTGTLTEGKPKVVAVIPAKGGSEAEVLRLAASVERGSEHPLAAAIVAAAAERGIALAEVADFDFPTGKGVVGTVEGRKVALGKRQVPRRTRRRGDFARSRRRAVAPRRRDRDLSRSRRRFRRHSRHCRSGQGECACGAASAARRRFAHRHADRRQPRDRGGGGAAACDRRDRSGGAARIEKGAVVEKLRREGRVVAMAGDGVNDAPALAAADVGIAMGTGTDVAIESAGITLLKGDLAGLVRARHLSRATMRNIRQNLFFAFIYNGAAIPIAAGILYPAFGILLSPIIGAAAMALSSVSVIAQRLAAARGQALKRRLTAWI